MRGFERWVKVGVTVVTAAGLICLLGDEARAAEVLSDSALSEHIGAIRLDSICTGDQPCEVEIGCEPDVHIIDEETRQWEASCAKFVPGRYQVPTTGNLATEDVLVRRFFAYKDNVVGNPWEPGGVSCEDDCPDFDFPGPRDCKSCGLAA